MDSNTVKNAMILANRDNVSMKALCDNLGVSIVYVIEKVIKTHGLNLQGKQTVEGDVLLDAVSAKRLVIGICVLQGTESPMFKDLIRYFLLSIGCIITQKPVKKKHHRITLSLLSRRIILLINKRCLCLITFIG